MPKHSPNLQLEIIPGDLYPDLESAQRAARLALASDFALAIRAMLSDNRLIQRNGRIEPNE